ncbi:MAG: sigma-70 family RNA polymerase sigma factor [Rubrivivax sp.]|nr:sigma-70 family RNA polymerase sigma factor [Rubrivivax sp.]
MSDDLARAFEAAYPELLRLARSRLRQEQAPISTRTLAHELYLGLQHRTDLRFGSRGEFLAYAGKAMRHLLVDLARERLAQKRDADLLPLTLGQDVADDSATPDQVLMLNQALEQLGRIDPRLLQVAEMRAVLGLEVPEVAVALGVSEPTVKRDWQRARAFLYDALGRAS